MCWERGLPFEHYSAVKMVITCFVLFLTVIHKVVQYAIYVRWQQTHENVAQLNIWLKYWFNILTVIKFHQRLVDRNISKYISITTWRNIAHVKIWWIVESTECLRVVEGWDTTMSENSWIKKKEKTKILYNESL